MIITPTQLIERSNAIRGFPINPIKLLCSAHTLRIHDEVNHFNADRITEWLEPYCDLSPFGYQYPLNGITEGLNYWMFMEKRTIEMREGDYQWVQGKPEGDVIYWSYPSSIDGNYHDIPTHKPVILDLAYVASTKIKKFEIPDNVEMVFFSLSKCFGVRNYRIGWAWTREPIRGFELLIRSAKYYNYYSMSLGEKLIELPIDLVYNTLEKYQKQLCNELKITPSDTVWLATSEDPIYNIKRRGNNPARLCLTDAIEELYRE